MRQQEKWIFLPLDNADVLSLVNLRVLARKKFKLTDLPQKANLSITADSRYRLFINGQWVNDGPERCFPWRYSYDKIDVTSYMRKGENVVCVIVQYYGDDTFQHIVTYPGLLAHLEIKTAKSTKYIVTNDKWKIAIDSSYNRRSGRISCQMPYEEQVDARKSVNWLDIDFDDSQWADAKIIADAKSGPWKNLVQRDIPLLSREPVFPARIERSRFVRAPRLIEGFNLKRHFWPNRTDINRREFHCIIATNIKSSCRQEAKFYKPTCSVVCVEYYLNGTKITFSGKGNYNIVNLRKGDNILIAIADGISHFDDIQLILDAPKSVYIENPFGKGKWAVAGPFDSDEAYAHYTSIEKLKRSDFVNRFKSVSDECIVRGDVHAAVVCQEELTGQPCIVDAEHMLNNNAEITRIRRTNKDIEILLDFGKEYNMYVEFEMCAPSGIVIDAHCFEAFKYDGTPQYTRYNRSGFRYVTKSGWQKFVSFRHFGARYVILTFRNVSDTVEIKTIKGHFVHYPVSYIGQFQSNDYLINKIWDIGKQTMLCCMEDTFTDCPTYEQTYWVGDGRNEALISYYLFDAYDLAKRCVKLPAFSLRQSPLVVSQVPSGWNNILPAWSFLWVQMIWEYYFHSADIATLKQMYPYVRKMLNNCIAKFTDTKTGLFSIEAWNMFDWINIDDKARIVAHNNAFLVQAYRSAAKMADVLNLKTEKRYWLEQVFVTVTAINKYLWDEKQSAYIDSIHDDGIKSRSVSRPVNTLMLLYDIAPADRAEKIKPIILGKRTKNVVPFGSPFAMFYLLEYFAKEGYFSELMNIIRENWQSMLEFGATTCWETFKNSSCSPQGSPTRSHCHGWSAGVNYFLSKYVLGVYPLKPGFKKVLIAPNAVDLHYAKGQVPTHWGAIAVEWEKTRKGLDIKVDAPKELQITYSDKLQKRKMSY